MARVPRPLLAAFAAASLLPSRGARAEEYLPAGSPIEQALSADLAEAGLNFLLGEVSAFLPPDLVVGTIPSQELVDLFFCQQDFWLENLVIHTAIHSITADGTPDALRLIASVDVWINDPANPAVVKLAGCMDYTCFMYTEPATFVLEIPITFALSADENGDPYVDVVIGEMTHNIEEAMQGKVHLTDCAVGDINEFLDEYLGFNLFDLVIAQFVGEIESQVAEQLADLEITIEDAMRALWQEGEQEILDTTLTYDIHPTAIDHNDLGLRMVMGGSLSTTPAPCVAGFDDPGSQFTLSTLPPMTDVIPETGEGYHLAGIVADDFVNQALHAVWKGGVMCYAVADLGGTPLTTTYLGLMLGQDWEERLAELFFLGEVPMMIRTVPETPPVARFDGENDINVDAIGLNIEFYPLMQDRFARLAAVAIDVHAGIDVGIDETGALSLDIHLDTENLNPRVTYNEIAPDLNPALESNFPGFLGVVLDTMAGSLLEGVAFAMPTFNGLGLTGLELFALEGAPDLYDWLGAYATLGETTGGEGSGCDSCGGSGGCSEGCGGEGCGGEGCGGEGGCDLQAQIDASGCSGEASELPSDTGCTGCRVLASGATPRGARWRVLVDEEGTWAGRHGAVHRHGRGGFRPGLPGAALLLLPIILRARKRRA
jgi:hypothetical protein